MRTRSATPRLPNVQLLSFASSRVPDLTDPVIETHDLVKTYGKRGEIKAVDGVSLSIPKGEIFGLLGPNGAGKTTTISMLTTLKAPTSGSATVNGFDVVRDSHRVRQSVGIVFQEPSLDSLLTGRENLDLHARLYDVPRIKVKPRIAELLALVGLEARADHAVKTYSGGMKRRLEIARGLLHWPKVLFLDEPTLGLDPQTREHIWKYIEGMSTSMETTIVLTTHYMEEADRLCHRIGIIDKGKIIALGTPKELKAGLGGDVVRLRLKAPATAPFERLPFVQRAELVGSEVMLTVDNAERNLAAIFAAARDVEGVEVSKPTLNDVFLSVTGRSIRGDESAQESSWMDDAMRTVQQGER
ncbi:MAG: ATP-binding cassette domain-containing protein [Euryarchaeota archaeon]|nr:ATP-binding cassette domain-containing protein [Euryarchaeota archaeon]